MSVGTPTSYEAPLVDAEQIARFILALKLGQDTCLQPPRSLVPTVDGLCVRLGVSRLTDIPPRQSGDLDPAIMTSLTASGLPFLECKRALHSTLKFLIMDLQRDTAGLLTMSDRELRARLDALFNQNPAPALHLTLAIGRNEWRPDPSGGHAALAARINVVEWQDGLFGMDGLRGLVRTRLERESAATFFALERWSIYCPDHCCSCPAQSSCSALCRGLI